MYLASIVLYFYKFLGLTRNNIAVNYETKDVDYLANLG